MSDQFACLRFRRTITIVLEGSADGVSACAAAMGTHIPEALNFKPPEGSSVSLTINEAWIDEAGQDLAGRIMEALKEGKTK
jgi:hypothetical protein